MGVLRAADVAALPTVAEVLLSGNSTDRRVLALSLAAASPPVVGALWLGVRHWRALATAPDAELRGHYRRVVTFPLVMASCCWLAIALPRLALGALLAAEVWEAVALAAFAEALVALLGGAEEAVKVLAGEAPAGMFGSRNRWCVPPCCCLVPLAPCSLIRAGGVAPFEGSLLRRLRRMVEQYCYVAPLAAGMAMGAHLLSPPELSSLLVHTSEAAQSASLLVCLQALFVLYRATKHALAPFHTTAKFLGIKAMLLLSLLQRVLVLALARHGLFGDGHSVLYTPAVMATRLQAFLLAWELPVLQLLVNRAFPLSDLQQPSLAFCSSLSV
mmetsp:Transcript_21263/g.53528  ORF Transcript_21263/g.53528 Transcript_21263/m.53528 type:complete len:329 (+) Transcript_21263:374-1360(+)